MNETYSIEEFFYDTSFEDYDIQRLKELQKEVAKTHQNIGDFIAIEMFKQNINLSKMSERTQLTASVIDAILCGKYELDLKTICKFEAALKVKIVSTILF